jgi:hypothetical protein
MANAGNALHSIDDRSSGQTANHDMVLAALAIEQPSTVVAGRLDHHNPAYLLALLVGLMHEEIGEGTEKPTGAKLKDGFL